MDTLLKEYDGNLVNNVTSDNLFGLLDASSLLWRLEVRASVVGRTLTLNHIPPMYVCLCPCVCLCLCLSVRSLG